MADKQSERQINIDGGVQAVVGENRGTVNQYLQDIRHEIVLITPETVYQKYTLNRRSPYQALRRFDVDKAEYFQGRKQLIKELIEAIESSNLVLVLGASGSGKSSVVRAGLIPEFLRSGSHCHNFVLTPGENPFESLYESLLGRYKVGNDNEYHFGESSSKIEFVQFGAANTFTQIRTTLVEQNSKWLIFVDQFEELFTRCQSLEQQRAFIDSITEIAESEEDSIKIVLAMRADFLEPFTPYPQFGRIVQRNIHLVTDMYPEELELAIKYPAMLHGVTFEPGLVPRILENIQGQAGYLPLLQYTLHLLWDYECNKKEGGIEDKVLNVDSYEELGGVRGALQKHIDSIYQKLGEQEQKAAKRIFMELVKLVETEDSRLVPVSQRAYRATFKGEVIKKTLQTFIDEKLLVSSTERLTKEALQGEEGQNIQQSATVEIAHEILLNSWSTLKEWIEESKDVLIVKSRLAEDMGRWHDMLKQDKEKANEELLTGSRLERVLELRREGMFELREMPLKPEEIQFIDVSVEWRDRQLREREEQIQKLNLALTETSLREKAARALNLLPTQPLDALVLSIQVMGENLDKLPQKILTPVQSSLNMVMEQARELSWFQAHDTPIFSLALSPDGQKIVIGSSEGTFRLWNLKGVPISNIFSGHEKAVYSVAFSPNSEKIVSGSEDGTIRLWDLQANYIVFNGHQDLVRAVAFSPTEEKIVSGSNDGTLCLWDFLGNLLIQFRGNEPQQENDAVCSVAFSPDGTKIVSGHSDKKLRLWNLQGILIAEPFQGHQADDSKDAVSAVAFNPTGDRIVSGGVDRTVRLWDLEGNQIGDSFRGHDDIVCSVAFSPDGQKIVSGSASFDKTLRLWDLEGNLIGQPFRGHIHGVRSVFFTPDSQMIISGGLDGTVRLWDLQGNQIGQGFQGHNDAVCTVAFSPDGDKIVSGSWHWDGALRLWLLENNPPISALLYKCELHHRITSVAFSPDGKNMVSSSSDGKIHLWDSHGSLLKEPIQVHEVTETFVDGVSSVAFSPDSQTIVTAGQDSGDEQKGTLRLWNLEGHPINSPFEGHQGKVLCVAWSPDGQIIISGGSDSTIYLWNLEGKLINQLKRGQEYKNYISSVAFSPDGRMIVSVFDNATLALWNLETSSISKLIQTSYNSVYSVAFSPDGQTIISAGLNGTLRLWDLEGNPIGQTFQGYKYGIHAIAFSPDSQVIASGDGNKTVCLWRGHWRAWLQVCCDRLKYHPVFKNPQTDTEKQAKASAEKYIWNPQIGAKELYDKATQRLKEKDFNTAITLLHHAISCYPDYTQAYYQRGNIFYQMKRYFDAIKDLNYVLNKQPNRAQVYHYRGLCYRQINNFEKAKADLQKAAQLYQQQGKQKEAQQIQRYLND